MKIIIKTLMLFIAGCLYAQQELPSIMPPSPDAHSLALYGMVPVSHYTGVPNINIPIHTLNAGDLQLPISLSYHASGIKIDQVASRVGLGWSLNAGGVITRTPKGLPDDTGIYNGSFTNFTWEQISGLVDNSGDTEPDIYTYNFNGYSGQFILDFENNLEACSITNDKGLKIEVDFNLNPGLSSITITTDDGTKYYFNDKENSTSEQREGPTLTSSTFMSGYSSYTSAWYLTKITSANDTYSIDFNYVIESSQYKTSVNATRRIGGTGNQYLYNVIDEYAYRHTILTNHTKSLASITTSNGTQVSFVANSTRKDLDDTFLNKVKPLKEIKIFQNDTVIKHELTTSYFNASNSPVSQADHKDLRLRLDAVTLHSDPEPYTFNYYGDDTGEPSLPARTTNDKRDFWGYYNGKSSSILIPESLPSIFPVYGIHCTDANPIIYSIFQNLQGADLTPSYTHTRANTLKKVTYPTKGFSEYIFEENEAWNQIVTGGIRIKKIIDNPNNGSTPYEREYTYKVPDANYNMQQAHISSGYAPIEPTYVTAKTYKYDLLTNEPIITFFRCGNSGVLSASKNYLEVTSQPTTSFYDNGGNYMGYSYVLETDNNGATLYHFTGVNEAPNTTRYRLSTVPQGSNYSYVAGNLSLGYAADHPESYFLNNIYGSHHNRGLLKAKIEFNSSGNIVKKSENTYNLESYNKNIFGIRAASIGYAQNLSLPTEVYLGIYMYDTGRNELTSTKVTTYSTDGTPLMEIITDNTYPQNDPYRDFLRSSETTLSNGSSLKTEFQYPFDFSSEPYSTMTTKNMISLVVNKKVTKTPSNGTTQKLSEEKTDYYDFGSGMNELILPKSISTSKNLGSLEERIQFHSYYNNGNVKELSKADGTHTVYIWGYNEEYPIAKIENAESTNFTTYQQIKITAAINASDVDSTDVTENTLRNKLEDVRVAFPNAMVSTYTYDPLIGVTSITDPRGYTTYYEYDDFNRLKQVKDADGNIVSENKYHYKGQ